ncbi:glycosyltransferase family 4 protein [Peteryoungia desertarenae]|uniref:Glycosyltransferase family 4 protein n=1 Tax=Peteryoungia desertarenae TaxID=1813451 RepID=A0ABX6QK63_9HYPH|nr:glycosyltransferase family 4 protein [Peteryoungia desertarenae]QLF68943.1 glycosyltransferase family 4 protein [Peteryoungia desertarenae]
MRTEVTTDQAPLKVLMTLDAVGGVWRYSLNLASALADFGVETVFLGFGPAPDGQQEAEARAIGTLEWSDQPLDWMASGANALAAIPDVIAEVAGRMQADLLHLNLPSQASGLVTELPVLVVSHSCVPTWFQAVRGHEAEPGFEWHHGLNAEGLAGADLVVTPSRSHGELVTRCYGPLPHLATVQNGSAAPETEALKQPFVFSAGRWWDEGKNGQLLDLAAASSLWPIRVAGSCDGPGGEQFRFLHVEHLGALTHRDLLSHSARAAIFVSPSRYEPFGLAVLEAARGGAALVLSDIPTYRELWDDAAIFIDPHDPLALAGVLNGLADQPFERDRLGWAARLRSRSFTTENQAERMVRLYRSLLRPAVEPRLLEASPS